MLTALQALEALWFRLNLNQLSKRIKLVSVKKILTILLLIPFLLSFRLEESPLHAFYISTAKIEIQSSTTSKANITILVFTDDLENAIRNFDESTYQISNEETFVKLHTPQIRAYFQKHFQIKVNDKPITQQYISGSLKNDVYQLEFEIPHQQKWSTLEINANYLMELFPDQTNVMHIVYGDEKRYGKVSKGAAVFKANF